MDLLWALLDEELGNEFERTPAIRRGVLRLAEAFTQGREGLGEGYLSSKSAREAYLAYYVPLNFQKIERVLQAHLREWLPGLVKVAKERVIRVVDFGCGPGTAALAFLSVLAEAMKDDTLTGVELLLIDHTESVLKQAEGLVRRLAAMSGVPVTVRLGTEWASVERGSFDVALSANVLNELDEKDFIKVDVALALAESASQLAFFLEPSHRVPSQKLVRARERILKAHAGAIRVLGPCAHSEKCPVVRTDNWCHFSEPVREERFLEMNRSLFQDPRGWLKFSYLCLAWGKPVPWTGGRYRAIGDLHRTHKGQKVSIDLCAPGEKREFSLAAGTPRPIQRKLVRGALLELSNDGKIRKSRLLSG